MASCLALLAPLLLAQASYSTQPDQASAAPRADLARAESAATARVQELERALAAAEHDRDVSEDELGVLQGQLGAIQQELAGIREELAGARAHEAEVERAQASISRAVDAADGDLRRLLSELVVGSSEDAPAVLARAAQAVAAANSRSAAAWIAMAQDAVARKDLYAARRAIAGALAATSGQY